MQFQTFHFHQHIVVKNFFTTICCSWWKWNPWNWWNENRRKVVLLFLNFVIINDMEKNIILLVSLLSSMFVLLVVCINYFFPLKVSNLANLESYTWCWKVTQVHILYMYSSTSIWKVHFLQPHTAVLLKTSKVKLHSTVDICLGDLINNLFLPWS